MNNKGLRICKFIAGEKLDYGNHVRYFPGSTTVFDAFSKRPDKNIQDIMGSKIIGWVHSLNGAMKGEEVYVNVVLDNSSITFELQVLMARHKASGKL